MLTEVVLTQNKLAGRPLSKTLTSLASDDRVGKGKSRHEGKI